MDGELKVDASAGTATHAFSIVDDRYAVAYAGLEYELFILD
jgi:hypothetical protein